MNDISATYFVCHGIILHDQLALVPDVIRFRHDAKTRIIAHKTFAALASELPGQPDPLSGEFSLFEDEDEVATLASNHNQILLEAAEKVDVIPLQLGSAYSSKQAIVAMIDENETHFNELFKRISGALEVSVKVLRGSKPQPSSQPNTSKDGQSIKSGRDYLLQRASQKRAKDRASKVGQDLALKLIEALKDVAREVISSEQRLDDKTLCDIRCLVSRTQFEQFTSLLNREGDALAVEGFKLSATGPWAPYHFVRTE